MFGKLFIKELLVILSICLLASCTSITKATDEMNDAQQKKIKTAKINSQLGLAYLQMGNLQRAKLKLLLALQQAPTIPEPWYSMAFYLEKTGNKEDADTYYRKAIEIAPSRGDAHNNYGTYLCRTGKSSESIEHFLLALKDPTYLDAAGAYENAGLCSLKINKFRQAKHFFNQALIQEPTRATSLYSLAETNYKLGESAAAKVRLKEFLSTAPKTAENTFLFSQLMTKLTDQPKQYVIAAKGSNDHTKLTSKLFEPKQFVPEKSSDKTVKVSSKLTTKSSVTKLSSKLAAKPIQHVKLANKANDSSKISSKLIVKSTQQAKLSSKKKLKLAKQAKPATHLA